MSGPQADDPDAGLSPEARVKACAKRDVDRVVSAWPLALVDAQARGYGTGRSFDGTSRGGSELTSVEAAAIRPDFATGWLAELGDVLTRFGCNIYSPDTWPANSRGPVPIVRYVRSPKDVQAFHNAVDGFLAAHTAREANEPTQRLRRLAARSENYWPPAPRKGQVIAGVTVGERGSQAHTCAECGEPVVSGRDPETGQPLMRHKDGQYFHGVGGCYWRMERRRKASAKARGE